MVDGRIVQLFGKHVFIPQWHCAQCWAGHLRHSSEQARLRQPDSGEPEHKHFSVRFTKGALQPLQVILGVAWSHCWVSSKREGGGRGVSPGVNRKCKNMGVWKSSVCKDSGGCWGIRGVARLLRGEAAAGFRVCLIRSGVLWDLTEGTPEFCCRNIKCAL